ncbi:Secretory phospholipase A2 receptor [Myotis davidii]|uniref:Secretory phospholipase A2 receptor n=1 Tax=Myotis davidii TaxID=225400 RepID=L5LQ64_MYODS|nr:Secretory phospholipase A2 receptor [Myotis davidii]
MQGSQLAATARRLQQSSSKPTKWRNSSVLSKQTFLVDPTHRLQICSKRLPIVTFHNLHILMILDKGIFVIQSESLKKCIQAGKSVLTLENCKPPNKYMMWKWVSNHGLFNLGGSGCLGLNLSDPEQPLSIYECDSIHVSLRWRCNRKVITSPLQYMVQVKDNTLVASWKNLHKWIAYMSGGGGICEYLHKDLYTLKGNAHGTPCMFPFQYNHQWHHECTREGREDNLLWCATTSRYERDEKWGFCPDPTSAGMGCDAVWEKDLNSHICYQFNLLSSLSWSEAHVSCQMQGGALLSIADEAEESFIRKHLRGEAVEVWMGLNQLDENAGWQWSDRTPLSHLNWNPDKKMETQKEGHWKVKHCEEALPYICEKAGHVVSDAESGCPEGWERHGGFCYKIDTELRNFDHAASGYYCPPALVTITNRFEQAFITSLISSVVKTKDSYFWIALQDQNDTGEYTWKTAGQMSEPVRYTHWNAHQPRYSGGCVVMRGRSPPGRWEVKDCTHFKAMSLCKQPVESREKTEHEERWPFHPCYLSWESEPGLASCFKVFHSEKVLMKRTWGEAEAFCEEFGAHLASFAHIEEENFVNKLLHSKFNRTEERQFWIGFNKRNPLNAGSWEWSDGTPDAEYLFHTFASEWSDLEFVCGWLGGDLLTIHSAHEQEFILSKIRVCLLVKIPKGPSDWKNWTSAQDFCVDEGGTLVTIENKVEQAFITMNLYGQTTDVWIGLQSDDYEKWLSGKRVVYSNWSPIDIINIPSHNTTEVQKHIPLCALLSSNANFHFTGKWYFEDCGKEGYGFVCEKMQDTSGHGVNASDMYPIPNTLDYGNKTYKIISANMTWYTAMRACMLHGAELASITDQYHQSFLTVILNRLGHAHWIGLFSADDGLSFDWLDGTKSSFTFWKEDEPSFLGDCGFADTNGFWSITACETFLQGAVCHVPTGSSLLTIKDEAESSFLLEELSVFVSSVQMVWLNAQFDDDNKTMKWFDGTPTDQSNWGIRKPEMDHIKPPLCAALRIPEGVWQLSPCQEKRGFICKLEADIRVAKEHPGKGPSHSIVPLAVALTLIAILAISTLAFYISKHRSGAFRRLVEFRNPYYPTTNFSAGHLEENILISDFEKNDQQ